MNAPSSLSECHCCWLALTIWKYLGLDEFWKERLPASRQGTGWLDILKVQACYRLIDPGSEWRLYRRWYENCAMGDLLGLDPVIPKDRFYRVLDRLEPHRRDFFAFLKERWAPCLVPAMRSCYTI